MSQSKSSHLLFWAIRLSLSPRAGRCLYPHILVQWHYHGHNYLFSSLVCPPSQLEPGFVFVLTLYFRRSTLILRREDMFKALPGTFLLLSEAITCKIEHAFCERSNIFARKRKRFMEL